MPNLTAYGFISLEDLATQRVVDLTYEQLSTAITLSLSEHTRQINELISQLVQPTEAYKLRYLLPSGGSLQPLDAKGNPIPVKPSGSYDVAFPIKGAGTAWGDDRISRAMMTVQDADRYTIDMLERDIDWLKRHILAAIFTNTTYTYTDELYGDLTIQPLANGDAVIYVVNGGTASTDNHFYAQAANIADATNPFGTFYAELDEHPSNTGPYIAYIASNLVSQVESLTALVPVRDPSIEYNLAQRVLVQAVDVDNTRRVMPPEIVHFGDRLIGKVNGVYVVEWSALPTGYGFVHASGVNDVLGMREYPAPELKGLFPEFNNVNGNLREIRGIRFAGFGALNRVGALAFRIGNGTYAIPSGFAAPLPA